MMLLAGNSSIKKTHYEVLSVKEDASYDEIRASYRAAVLNSHPDKLPVRKPEASEPHHDLQERFLDIQKAWVVLCDSTSRANYDDELRASRQELEVLANEVNLGEMMVETVGDAQELLYQCRCGDYFSVTSLELREMGIYLDGNGEAELQKSTDSASVSVLLPCGSCSLKIRLIFNVGC